MKYLDELQRTPEILSRVDGTGPDSILSGAPRLVFCGCGTSFHIAGQLANVCAEQGKAARAVEAVEIIELPRLEEAPGSIIVFISRSGNSLETVIAANRAKQEGLTTFYMGCTENSRLDRDCDKSRVIGFARETLAVESYSYAAQLLCLALISGLIVERGSIPAAFEDALRLAGEVFRTRLLDMPIERIIFLGATFYMPLLREMRLKSGEITQKCSEVWGVLEFRHGPRSWADETCLIAVLPGIKTYDYDRRLAEELVQYGSRVIWFGKEPIEHAVNIRLTSPAYSVEAVLTLAAFLTGLSVEIGEDCGVEAAHIKNLDYSVQEL